MFDDLDPDVLRRNPGVKWAQAGPDVLPAWIADMDFPVAEPMSALLRESTGFGYPAWDDRPELNPLPRAFAERMKSRYDFSPDPAHVRVFTELNQALQVVLHVATRPGDAVAVHTPGYPPFLETLRAMDRRLVPIPMVDDGDGWSFDTDRLAADVARHRCRALLLVNPHNPTGRVLTRDELAAIAEVAEQRDLLVIADEVHADLAHEPYRHIPFGSLTPRTAGRTITLTSASKAFNLGGLRCSVAHVGDARVRAALAAQPPLLFGEVSSLSVLATVAAWERGDDWLAKIRATLARNRRMVAESLPAGIRLHAPEASYLAWLDCRELNLDQDPAAFFLDQAKVMLSQGLDFGPAGKGFSRLNFATSGPILQEILHRIREAVQRATGAGTLTVIRPAR